jgi:penicillin-binding protein
MKKAIASIRLSIKQLSAFFKKIKLARKARILHGVVWNIGLIFIFALVICCAFSFGLGAGYFASLVKQEPLRTSAQMRKDIFHYEETSTIYFADRVYLGKLGSDIEQEEVSSNQVSKQLIDALIATEDENFYIHDGIVPKALFRAIFQEMSNSSVQSGGSTLTQQIIKNQILTNEVSFNRKAKEVLLAMRMEKFFSKNEILEAYLNATTFGRNSTGQNIAGVQSAAKGIFGVPVCRLTIPQAAFIAGLPQSPFRYTPFTNEGTLKKDLSPGLLRMKTVLKRMYGNGFITEKEYSQALKYNIVKDFNPPRKSPREKYPWLANEIEERAVSIISGTMAKKDGYQETALQKDKQLNQKYRMLARRTFQQNGYKIFSTVNKGIYDNMQYAKNHYKGYGPIKVYMRLDNKTGERRKILEPEQIGSILIENKTGKILSFVGGRDFHIQQLNHATQAMRPNGSTMKPLLAYAPAMELQTLSPGSIIADVDTGIRTDKGKPWPINFSRRYYGLVSARSALANSYNVSAVKVYNRILKQKPAAYLEKMGITTLTEKDYEIQAAVLGGITNGVTVEENVNAYTTFANKGTFMDAYLIERIEDKAGKTIYQHHAKPVKVFSPQTSYLMLDMMRDVLKYGTAMHVPGMLKFTADWAGKTGTSNDYHDSWFIASNPNVTFGTWIGYDTPSSLVLGYSLRNQRIWSVLMNAAFDADPKLIKPTERFQKPIGIVKRSYCSVSGNLPSSACVKAGLVSTDFYNVNHVPAKRDQSLIIRKYVMVKNKKYLALPSTPAEFSQSGFLLEDRFIKQLRGGRPLGLDHLIPPDSARWSHILVSVDHLNDDGNIPVPVVASALGRLLKWSPSQSTDVIGYRIYSQDGQQIASIMAVSPLAFPIKSGSYYVTAVDIAGNESPLSNPVTVL